MKAGTILKNGAIVLDSVIDWRGETRVLAFVQGAVQPFVVWAVNEEGETFSGMYSYLLREGMQELNYWIYK